MGSLKLIEIAVFVGMFVEAEAGTTLTTVGGVMSGAAAVVKFHASFAARAFPAASFAPVLTEAE